MWTLYTPLGFGFYPPHLKLEHVKNRSKRLLLHNVSVMFQSCHNGRLYKMSQPIDTLEIEESYVTMRV